MSDDKKSTSPVTSTLSTGGFGIILSGLVAFCVPDANSGLAKLLYLFIPLISAGLTYILCWVIARHGLESPEDAAKRKQCLRDLKTIDEQLASKHTTDEFRQKLLRSREATVEIMINIGKNSTANPLPEFEKIEKDTV
ncbi:TPA: hypothetical protein F6W26_22945 [Citrobacter amalonaticus]|uniref:hypothetical protein n=1 Tax=Citrobacter amalonaticus TaxID=35703 RepID=UPI000F666933|nr:hypothetical protein [Citrobacter amalonaticus]RSC60166.1 hypothetical protein EGW07_22140 [Citrobacter amalonaticus]HAT7523581.1 hypothetical protein [Citrobacter koseri]HAU4370759.1 hypothetical protein [Citrobacter amalonaticus]HEM6881808.1 hypothetical protein [Citrobacter amalonaticus]